MDAKHNNETPLSGSQSGASERSAAARLDGLLHELAAQKQVKHAVLAVEKLDGSFRWAGATGEANPDGTPMEIGTPYCIASVTKLYIAATIVQLAEGGQVALDSPIAAYLPQSLIGGIHRLNGVDYTEKITVRHLLGHMSGLPDYLEDTPKGGKSLFEHILAEDRSYTTEEAMAIVRETLRPHFAPQPLDAKRHRIRYSDTNYQLLIAIIEAVRAQPIHQAFGEMIYAPLGLKQTFHPGVGNGPEPRSATIWNGEKPLEFPLALRSFRDLVSTVDDLLGFMRGLVQGKLFRQPQTLHTMMGNWNTFGFTLNLNSPKWPMRYGLGMMRFQIPRLFSPFRAVPAVVGHTGATGSWLFYCPELELVYCGTVDQIAAGAAPFGLTPKLLRVFE
jgi:D-alanyl-D-alanine carboxypeptidase